MGDVSVQSLCSLITSGGTPNRARPEYYTPGNVPWVKTGDLRDSGITSYDEYISLTGLMNSSAKILPKHTILMAMYGATVGRLGWLSEPASCNQAACALVADSDRCDWRWLFYALMWTRDSLVGLASGAAQQNLNAGTIRAARLPAFDLLTQRAIAEVLGALDDKIAANDRVAESARVLAREVYVRFTLEARRQPMLQVLEPLLGGTPSRGDESLWDGAVAWLSAKDVASSRQGVVVDTTEGISLQASATRRLRPLPVGSVVLTARGTVGEVAQLSIESAINQSCYGFVPGHIPSASLAFVLEDVARHARSLVHGSVFDTITTSTFEHLSVPALSLAEWATVESAIGPLQEARVQMVREAGLLAVTRDELLPLLMSGRLRVKDAEKVVAKVV